MQQRFTAFLFFLLFALPVLADSPLTSTDFSTAYAAEPMVAKAAAANGLLTEELIVYLLDGKQPIDVQMAVINRLGWSFDGKKNSRTFLDYLFKNGRYRNEADFRKRGKGHELLAMAYLLALDDYFNVSQAVDYADTALKKAKKSYTFRLIAALIKAQHAMDSDWCRVYRLADEVRRDDTLKMDMKSEAADIVYAYMDLYADSCG